MKQVIRHVAKCPKCEHKTITKKAPNEVYFCNACKNYVKVPEKAEVLK